MFVEIPGHGSFRDVSCLINDAPYIDMSSRKRKDPLPPESPRTPSKRTRFQQANLPVHNEPKSSGLACKYGTSRSAYAINGILDESEDKYLIDWAPGLAGSTWPPDWVNPTFLVSQVLYIMWTEYTSAFIS